MTMEPPSTSLAHRSTVVELVAAFAQAEADVRHAFLLLAEANARLNAIFTLGATYKAIYIDASRDGHGDDFNEVERTIERMARGAWGVIVDRLELRRAMSITRWEEMSKQLQHGKLPPITEENVFAFARHHAGNLETMIREAVDEIYKWLRPRSGDYNDGLKTNEKNGRFTLGPKIILTGVVSRSYSSYYSTRHGLTTQRLMAMENVFAMLDGAAQVSKAHESQIEIVLKTAGKDARGETPYFRFQAYSNGNLHLGFRRLDLLARLNQIAGGKAMAGHPAPDRPGSPRRARR